ncbi:hypothetical protein BC828DRAFT_381551 [Blastocladiella britannica]|nr:hypothetical protein BC828DRAFT_381551 [Blastocladiella britannica]
MASRLSTAYSRFMGSSASRSSVARAMSTGGPTPPLPTTAVPAWKAALGKFSNNVPPGAPGFWREVGIVFTVFAVTGSSSLLVVRRGLNAALGEGSLSEGPNSWRAGYMMFGLPAYSAMLLTFGTLSGRGAYFRTVLHRMWGRMLPKSVADRLKV